MKNRQFGICVNCKRKLFLEPEKKLCVMCEIEDLKKQVVERDLALSQCRREKQALYEKLSRERTREA